MLLKARLGLIAPRPSTTPADAVLRMALFLYMASMSTGTASTACPDKHHDDKQEPEQTCINSQRQNKKSRNNSIDDNKQDQRWQPPVTGGGRRGFPEGVFARRAC